MWITARCVAARLAAYGQCRAREKAEPNGIKSDSPVTPSLV
ncbi:MAG: hypothetical protein U0527_14230 [Candidatus Eisenbacteria bacterium]